MDKIIGYEKNKYKKVEFSYLELQIINAVLQEAKHEEKDFFSKEMLEDTKRIIADSLNEVK